MSVQNYKDLIAWQKAMELVVEIYQITTTFPNDERFGLTNQLRRAMVSVPSNIAEGQGRGPSQDFVRFLCMARGALQEVDTQLILATRLGFIPQECCDRLSDRIIELAKIINGLIRSIPTGISLQTTNCQLLIMQAVDLSNEDIHTYLARHQKTKMPTYRWRPRENPTR